MEFSAKQIAELIKGTVEGNPEVKVSTLSKIEEGLAGSLSFLANPIYTKYIYNTEASIVIVNEDFQPERELSPTLIRVPDAYQAFAALLDVYDKIKSDKKGIEQPSYISESAKLGENVYVAAFAYIGINVMIGNKVKLYPHVFVGDNVEIGEGSVLNPGVKIYEGCKIGKNCIIHAGVIIGSDGFGFAPQDNNNYKKVPQLGNVILEDNVEIGSNTTIDRATIGSTIIRKGVKLDNLIQIAHNVDIGMNTVIAAQSGVSGSTRMGANCMIGGQVGIIGHINIADEVKIAAQSGIGKSIENVGEIVQGSPAFAVSDYQKSYVIFRRLPEMRKQIIEMEKEIKILKEERRDN